MVEETTDVDRVLDERATTYGAFTGVASVAQNLKHSLRQGDSHHKLAADQREALDMIVSKLARIVNGDPDYADSWVDIAGYAKLVADRLNGKGR
jgi:20S proteasome alpha/beta subunit